VITSGWKRGIGSLGRKKFLFFLTGFFDAMLVIGRINKILLHVFKDFFKSRLIKIRNIPIKMEQMQRCLALNGWLYLIVTIQM
jgi:hypothetical protein